MKLSHNNKHLSHPKYRSDIDGLRGLAVLLVVAFHAIGNSKSIIQGGFIGVDIFFVISGFLISTIVFENLDSGNFSFREFYSRRIRRIFPALILVLAASLVFGYFLLFADEYKQLGNHVFHGSFFVSNFALLKESGYFDNDAQSKPLLHLWSLAVEEQFYIIWPVLLWLVWKKQFNLLTITALVTIASFGFCLSATYSNKVAAFYLPQSRFWEILLGSILAYISLYKANLLARFRIKLDFALNKIFFNKQAINQISGKTLKNFTSILGAILIVIGVLLIDKNHNFPGVLALLPTVGTVLIIASSLDIKNPAWFNRVFLQNRLLVWFGLISFPLYLWHWPLLSFVKIITNGTTSAPIICGVILISIILAYVTYRFIENPLRFGNKGEIKTIILSILIFIVGIFGYGCYKKGLKFIGAGVTDRESYIDYFDISLPEWKYIKSQGLSEKARDECNFYDVEKYKIGQATSIPRKTIDKTCFTRDSNYEKSVFIWGDSHAQQLNFGLKNHLPSNWQILQVASSGCEPKIDIDQPSNTDYCQQSNWFALKTIKTTRPDVIIIAQNLNHSIGEINKKTLYFKSLGIKKIIFTGPTPHWTDSLPKIIARQLWFNTPARTYVGIDQNIINENSKLQTDFKQSFAEANGAILINLIDFLCNKDGCLTRVGEDKKIDITSFDGSHLLPIVSDLLAKNLLINYIIEVDTQTKK